MPVVLKIAKCWQFFQELNSKGLFLRSEKERKGVFTSSIRSELGQFYVSSLAETAKKCTRKRDARAKLLFC